MNFKWSPKRYLITLLKVIGWITASVLGLLIILSLAIQIPFIQNKLTQKAVSFLKNKIGTEVRLQHISLSIPKKIVLTGLYLEDQNKDTLVYVGDLAINTDLWALTKHSIQLNNIELKDFQGNIKRGERDRSFNFDYIIKAFAGDSTNAPADTTQTPWKFSVGEVSLEQIRFRLDDGLEGNELNLHLGQLNVSLEEFDLENSVFKIDALEIEDLNTTFVQSKLAADTVTLIRDSAASSSFDIGLNEVSLKKIVASYNDRSTGQMMHLNLGELQLEAENISLINHEIYLDKLSLLNTFISYQQMSGYKTEAEKKKIPQKKGTDALWHVKLNDVSLSNNSIQYYNFDEPRQERTFDANHLWITNLNTKAKNLEWHDNQAKGELTNLSLQDRNGFFLTSFHTNFSFTDNAITLADFAMKSPHSNINLNAQATFASLSSLSQTYPEATVKLNVDETVVGWKDVAYFVPSLSKGLPSNIPQQNTIGLDIELSGALKNLTIHHFSLRTLTETVIQAWGTAHLTKKNPSVNLALEKFYTTKKDIMSIADTLVPASIAMPAWIDLRGNVQGTFDKLGIKTNVTSDFGSIILNASLKFDDKNNVQSYAANLRLKEFNTGKLLKKEKSLGPINMLANVKGSGIKMEDLNAKVDLEIFDFMYEGYTYQNFKLNGLIKKYFFSGAAQLQDKNLSMRLDGDLDYNADVAAYHLTFNLKNADFKALHLSERPLKARGTLNIDLATSDFKVINGKLDIRKVAIFNGESMYAVDSLLFASIDQKGESEISIKSDIIDGNFKGTINLYSLPEVLKRHFNNYFSMRDTSYTKPAASQNFKFDLKIKNTDLITEILIPELDPFVPGKIFGEFDSNNDKLNLSINLAKISYSGISADSITFDANSNKTSLAYTFAVRKVKMDTMRIEALKIYGNVQHDSIRTKLTILDSLQKEKYVLGGVFRSLEKVFQFQFLQNEVILNYAPWRAPSDNYLQFTSKGLVAHNFSITNINERIALETNIKQDSTASLVFKDLNLQNITRLIEGTTPVDGLANGTLTMMVSDKGSFSSKLRIDQLSILDQLWGDLSLALGQTTRGPLNVDLRLQGKTELTATGYLKSDPTSPEINMVANITKLDLSNLGPLTMGKLKETSGLITGHIKVNGNPSQPDISGLLTFKNAMFTPTLVNSKFTLENESITFTGEQITLKDFKIKDRENNIARINGDIKTSMFKTFDLNLALTAKDFQILNSTAKDNDLFYGNVSVTTKAKISGNFNQPVVDMNISLSDDSNFIYVVPQSEKGVLEQQGIVKFVDRDAKNDPFLAAINPKDTVKAAFKGIDLSANIELNNKETFNIIIDPATGDKLSVKGNSTLTLDIDPTGDMVLTGRYEITEGSYDLSFYKLVKRQFSIEKGSSIIWSGDPLDATMNIRAIYKVETSPIELIANQTADEQELNTYKQRLPFLVYLQIKGQLLAPEISFQLDMEESKRNAFGGIVYAKIRDINTRESELNKQVFALLVLKRFISDNPLDNRASSDVASTARRSVSRLLSEQLNRLSQNVKGVELSFDVKSSEDYSNGKAEGQTQVQLGLSKSLLDDRLIVKVSGNVNVEGEAASSQNSASDYIGDLALEYKLTEDGRFRITGFRNSNYDMINGELIETGVGLIYIKDYNTLRELFKANAKEN